MAKHYSKRRKSYGRKSYNREIGSGLYWAIFYLAAWIGIKVAGVSFLSSFFFALLPLIAYVLVRIILRKIGVWRR